MPVVPRIVNDVSRVTRINNASHFSWQAQYLVTLVDDTYCSVLHRSTPVPVVPHKAVAEVSKIGNL